jgi:hypothetical protein
MQPYFQKLRRNLKHGPRPRGFTVSLPTLVPTPAFFTQTAILISILGFIAPLFISYLPLLLMNCFPLEKHHMNFKSNYGNKNYLSLSNQCRHVNKTVLFTKFIPDPALLLLCSPVFNKPLYH